MVVHGPRYLILVRIFGVLVMGKFWWVVGEGVLLWLVVGGWVVDSVWGVGWFLVGVGCLIVVGGWIGVFGNG